VLKVGRSEGGERTVQGVRISGRARWGRSGRHAGGCRDLLELVEAGVERDVGGVEPGGQGGGLLAEQRVDEAVLVLGVRGQLRRQGIDGVVSDGDWTVPAAADRLGTSRQAVQRIANELVDDGLAAFEDNPRHRRSPFLRLSEDGRRALAAISAKAGLENQAILSGLDGLDLARIRTDPRQLTSAVLARLDDAGNSRITRPG
jgi:DNA-binding MarR family transcriptional regulator